MLTNTYILEPLLWYLCTSIIFLHFFLLFILNINALAFLLGQKN